MKINQRLSLIKNFVLLLLIACVFSFLSCPKKPKTLAPAYIKPLENLSDDAFALVLSSSVEGYIAPCGCTNNPLGGIDRFATVYGDVKGVLKQHIALIDAGNLLFDSPIQNSIDLCQDEKKIDVLLSTMNELGLTASLAGPLDNARGPDFKRLLYQRHDIQALPSLNDAKTVGVSPLKVLKTPAYDIAIFGVSAEHDLPKDLDLKIKNTVDMAKKMARVKAVVAISQMPLALTKETFKNQAGIDIVIQGQLIALEPKLPGTIDPKGPLLIEGGRQGQYFTALIFQNLAMRTTAPLILDPRPQEKNARQELLMTRIEALEKQAKNASGSRLEFLNKRIVLARNEVKQLEEEQLPVSLPNPNVSFFTLPLTRKVESHPAIAKKIADYEKSIPALVKKCEENIECPKPIPTEASYVGVQSCKTCHQAAYEVWQKAIYTEKALDENGQEISRLTGHSKAWKTLVDINKDKDRSCIGCHSVGFMEAGGYCKAFEVDFRKDVQCESCHGPGSLHAASGDKQFIKRKVSEETCRSCHHVPHISSFESFNYEKMVVKVLGKGHGESLLKELTHSPKSE